MNNLKKVLALGLALIMLMGMFTVVSAAETKMTASDLTDWDTVAHKDAVALMVDLGIINGMPDGSFAPEGNIDRASWAKMVYFAKTGSEDADAYVGIDTGLNDVAGKTWAEGYINYLKVNDLISGDNYGNYNPTSNVTVAEANKMILTSLGYDAEDRHYQNTSSWSANIMNDAKRYGLMDEVDRTQTALVALTRENAAQIVYNAMSANTVDKTVQWDGGVEHVTGYYIDQTLGFATFGIVPVPVKVNDIDANGNAVVGPVQDDPNGISAALYRSVKGVKASPSQVGEDAIVWVEVTKASYDDKTGDLTSATGYVKTISSTVARGKSAADVTFTQGFRWIDLTNSAKANYVADSFVGATQGDELGTVEIYINGVKNGGANNNAAAAKGIIESVTYDVADEEIPGTVVEFYLNDKGEIATIRAYIYNVAQMDGDLETRTASNGTLQVRLPGISAGGVNLNTWKDADKVTGYQGLAEGDVVLFYAGSNDSFVVEKAEKITGVVTGVNSSKQLTINGTKYKRTSMDKAAALSAGVLTPDGKSANQTNFSNWYNREDEFAFYLDKTGAICFTEQVTETLSKSNVALVMAAEWNGTSMSVATGKLQAKLLFMDGTQQIVDVSKVEGLEVVTTLSGTPSVAAKQIMGAPAGTSGVISKLDDNTATDDNGNVYAIAQLATANYKEAGAAFYNYRVVDGKYELTKVVAAANPTTEDDWTATTAISNAHIEKKADFSNGKAGSYTADSKTVFLVAKGTGDDKTFYTYTSFKNIPEMKSASGLAVGTAESGAAKYVFLDTEAYSDDVPDGYVFIINNKWDNDPKNEDYYLINIVDADGNITTLSVDETLKTAISGDIVKGFSGGYMPSTYVGHFCTVDDIDENGCVSSLTPVTGFKPITALGNDVVNDLYYDGVTKFVFVDMQLNDGDNLDSQGDDFLEFSGAGTFKPDGFYKGTDVDGEHVPGVDVSSSATGSFASVLMGTISADGEVADYVYVLRVVW